MSRKRIPWLVLAVAMLVVALAAACGPSEEPTPLPTPTRPMRPTFTPTVAPPPTATPEPATPTPEVPTATPEPPTATPEPATPTPQPNPVAVVSGAAQVNVRSGPGTGYPEVGQAVRGTELEIISRNDAGDWWQVCCVNGQEVWIVGRLVTVNSDTSGVEIAANIPTPPVPTRAPTPRPVQPAPTQPPAAAQPTAAPPPPAPAVQFVRHSNDARPNSNPIVSFFGGLYNQKLDLSKPVTGFKMVVEAPSGERKEAEFGPVFQRGDPGLPSEFVYNAKIEFPTADGTYRAWVADPGGNVVSEVWDSTVSGETRIFLSRWKQP